MLHVSDVWDDTRVAGRAGILRYLCVFVPWCRGGGIRRHMTETPDVFTPSQFDQAPPSTQAL